MLKSELKAGMRVRVRHGDKVLMGTIVRYTSTRLALTIDGSPSSYKLRYLKAKSLFQASPGGSGHHSDKNPSPYYSGYMKWATPYVVEAIVVEEELVYDPNEAAKQAYCEAKACGDLPRRDMGLADYEEFYRTNLVD
jgi:hypothetical protein